MEESENRAGSRFASACRRIASLLVESSDPVSRLADVADDLKFIVGADALVLAVRPPATGCYEATWLERDAPPPQSLVSGPPLSLRHLVSVTKLDAVAIDGPPEIIDPLAKSALVAPFDGPRGWPAWLLAFSRRDAAFPDGCAGWLTWVADLLRGALDMRDRGQVGELSGVLVDALTHRGALRDAMPEVAALLRRVLNADRVSLMTRGAAADQGAVVFADRVHIPAVDDAGEVKIASWPAFKAALAGARHFIARVDPENPLYRPFFAAGLRSALGFPLISGDEFEGFLFCASAHDDAYREGDAACFYGFATTLAMVLRVERQRAMLSEGKERYSELFERAPEMLQALDANGRVIDANEATLMAFERARADYVGRPFEEFLAPESVEAFRTAFAELKAHGRIDEIELRIARPSGEIREVVLSSAATASQGAVFSRDFLRVVTDTRRMLRERGVRHAALAAAMEARSVKDAAVATFRALAAVPNLRGGRVDIWDGDARSLRLAASVGLPAWETSTRDAVPLEQHLAREAIESSGPVVVSIPAPGRVIDSALRGLSGTLFICRLETPRRIVGTLTLLFSMPDGIPRDDVEILTAVAGDIGILIENVVLSEDLDQAHQGLVATHKEMVAREKLAVVGQLSAGIAHQINNPLGFTLGNVNLIDEMLASFWKVLAAYREAVPRDDRERLRLLEEEAGIEQRDPELKRLILDTLNGLRRIRYVVATLARFSAGTPSDVIVCDIHTAIDRALAVVRNEVVHRATLVKEFGDVPLLRIDPSIIEQAFVNLVINAAQAIEPGRVNENRIVVRTGVEGERVYVVVADTGSGISEQNLARVLDPFFTTKAAGRGTGLGLTLTNEFVRQAGGELAIDSTLGRGTTVTIWLPIPKRSERREVVVPPADLAPSAASSGAATPSPEPAGAPRSKPRLMIIDDEELTLRLLSRIFAREYQLLVAASGAQALEILERAGGDLPDVILCDLMMPDLTGMDLHALIEAKYPSLAPNLFFLTGGAFTEDARRFIERMRGRTFYKPLEVAELKRLVKERVACAGTTTRAVTATNTNAGDVR